MAATPALADPSVSVAFSPNGGATDAIVQVIREAQHTIHLAAYTFTSRPIAKALVQAHRRGVEVEAVLDRSNSGDHYTAATFLVNAGIPTRIDDRPAIMHDKFLIVDGVTVETGSFNYTAAAERDNAENVIILRGNPEVAARYEHEWQRFWGESLSYPQSKAP